MLLAHIADLHVMMEGDRAYGIVNTGPMVERAIAFEHSFSLLLTLRTPHL